MALIKKDEHGLYVKGCGCLARPVFPVGYQHVYKNETAFKENEKVKVTQTAAGPLVTLKSDQKSEKWYIHGSSKDDSGDAFFR